MKDIDLDCRKQTSAASMAGQFVQNEATCARFEHKPDGEKKKNLREFRLKKRLQKRWKIKKIIFQQLFFDLLKLIFLAANILLPAKSSQISYNIELFDHFLLNNIPKFTSQTLPKRLLNQHL